LVSGSESRVIGVKGGDLVDFDIKEALAMERNSSKKLMELSAILSI
jgi:hypothetical protein